MNRPHEVKLPEALITRPQNYLNQRQAETLHQAHLFELNASQFFFNNKDAYKEIGKLVSPIVDNLMADLSLSKGHIKQLPELEEAMGHDFPTLYAVLKQEDFSEKSIRQVLTGTACDRLIDIAEFKNRNISFDVVDDFAAQPTVKKLNNVLDEAKKNGLIYLDYFYGKYGPLKTEVDATHSIDELHAIWEDCKNKLRTSKEDVVILEKINLDIINQIRKLNQEAQGMGFKAEINKKPEEKRTEYIKALNAAFDYLRYCFSEEELAKSAANVEKLVKIMAEGRDNAHELIKYFASSYDLARRFWPILVGRDKNITDLEALGISKETFKKYLEKVFDKKIRTEAAAFWYERKTDLLPKFHTDTNYSLVYSIKSLLESHLKSHPLAKKNQQNLKIMILINDETSAKINISPNANLQEIIAILQKIQADGKINHFQLKDEDKYNLKHQAYQLGKHSQEYLKFYKHEIEKPVEIFGIKTPWKDTEQVDGDYIVRLTTKRAGANLQKTSPYSLFSVDSHKALVDIDLTGKNQDVELSIKFSHRHFDGRPAKKFFKNFYNSLKDYNDPQFDPGQTRPLLNFIIKKEDSALKDTLLPFIKTPLFEALASEAQEEKYQSVQSLSPNITRAVSLALANGVTDAHVLFASDDNPHWEGPYDNIQPTIISLRPILKIYESFKISKNLTDNQKKAVKEWIRQTNLAIEYTKKNLGAAAVLSAPPGRLQDPIYNVSRQLHKGAVLLKETPSMFSPLPDMENGKFVVRPEFEDTVFYSAQASAYSQRAKIAEAVPGLGVIGYIHSKRQRPGRDIEDQVFYGVRKSPIQALFAFKTYIDGLHPQNQKKVYSSFDKLIDNWEKFIIGEVSLGKYNSSLEKFYKSLDEKALKKGNINSVETLQISLNVILSDDAKNTINDHKISQEKKTLYEMLEQLSD